MSTSFSFTVGSCKAKKDRFYITSGTSTYFLSLMLKEVCFNCSHLFNFYISASELLLIFGLSLLSERKAIHSVQPFLVRTHQHLQVPVSKQTLSDDFVVHKNEKILQKASTILFPQTKLLKKGRITKIKGNFVIQTATFGKNLFFGIVEGKYFLLISI